MYSDSETDNDQVAPLLNMGNIPPPLKAMNRAEYFFQTRVYPTRQWQ